MTSEDIDPVVAIEQSCYSSPWSAELFRRELSNPLSTIELLWLERRLTGYLCTWRVADEMHILNVATSPEFRRRGVARSLLQASFRRCAREGVARVLLEVREGNAGAVDLYRSFGFRSSGLRRNYYPDGENALLMEWKAGGGSSAPAGKEKSNE